MFRSPIFTLPLLALIAVACPAQDRAAGDNGNFGNSRPGLSVDADGRLLLRGIPYRGLGVNVYDAFTRSLRDSPPRPIDRTFHALARHEVPFVRFSAGGYWPVDWGLYRTNRNAHFDRLDTVVKAAESSGLGLIPSLFWYPPTVSDLAGEPLDAWGDAKSETLAFMRTYTREIVERYRGSPAIWAWEFGNEFNLGADLPNAAEHRPGIHPALGTPSSRSVRDDLSHATLRVALAAFAAEVRRHDPNRLILSGNAFPRDSAWHQMHEKSWTRDAQAPWSEMLADDNPPPMASFSGRLYSAQDFVLLPWAAAASRSARRPLFIGEFGVPGAPNPEALRRFQEMLDALRQHNVPLAALWVVDYDAQDSDWNVTFENARAPLLDLLRQSQPSRSANDQRRAGAPP